MKKRGQDQVQALLFSAEVGDDIFEIDLHGYSEHEALRELDLFLDRAFMQGESVVRIVHGSGTGRLRDGVKQALLEHSFVEASAPASPPLGSGVTVVVMAQKA